MQLNLGCGFDRREGYVNVDSWPDCNPDKLIELESFPWPFESNSATRILARHVLEHLGGDWQGFQGLWKEIYRICAPGCVMEIQIPYYKCADFWSDPSHVRVYTPLTLKMLSLEENRRWVREHNANTKLAMMLGIDFEVISSAVVWEPLWSKRLGDGVLSMDELLEVERNSWNVVKELRFELKALK